MKNQGQCVRMQVHYYVLAKQNRDHHQNTFLKLMFLYVFLFKIIFFN